ncbi:MAG: hypothetical protein U0790_24640 [Isosphaeraceae bacterium]
MARSDRVAIAQFPREVTLIPRLRELSTRATCVGMFLVAMNLGAPGAEPTGYVLRIASRHAWRPPFGLDRVGSGIEVVVEARAYASAKKLQLVALNGSRELRRERLAWPEAPPFVVRRTPDPHASEVVLLGGVGADQADVELARLRLDRPEFEIDAVATASPPVNPIDLGTILVPSGWLLLGPGQQGTIEVAALSRRRNMADASIELAFESRPDHARSGSFPLVAGALVRRKLPIPEIGAPAARDHLTVSLRDGKGTAIWHKTIPVMLVREPPRWPRFGATSTKLRYDAPISVRDPATGAFSSLPYEDGWDDDLRDVVVSLPNGSRFVFWRGSSYIPFWAGAHNTGACYEWAEMLSRPDDAVDCVEPLMDKELRYGRVEIVESTPACVRVRWTYQSTDLKYRVWGDSAVEEYTFYPDGFGVRSLDLRTSPGARYELSEFIVLTPQGTYPLDVLPETLVEAIDREGKKTEFHFPFEPKQGGDPRPSPSPPSIYRLRAHRDDTQAAIYANPLETRPPPIIFPAFRDGGQIVTPCYWGSHWPLARGNATGPAIDDRVALTPCHNSVMSWADASPAPLLSGRFTGIDALGRSRPMERRRWAWPDQGAMSGFQVAPVGAELREPSLNRGRGGVIEPDAYVPERRAIRNRVQGRAVAVRLAPAPVCVNPVLELDGAPTGPITVSLDGQPLDAGRFAWDGRRLWLDATLVKPGRLRLAFGDGSTK